MITELDANKNPHKTVNVLQALRWGIHAWAHNVTLTAIINYWLKSQVLGPKYGLLTEQGTYLLGQTKQ